MGFKLGDISPLAGVLSGKGLMGKLAGSGGMGLLPAVIARNAQGKTKDEERAEAEAKANAEAEAVGVAQAQMAMRKQSDMDTMRRQGGSTPMKKGGVVKTATKAKKMAKGGTTSSASKRADGCAVKGKTKGRMV